MGRGGGLMDDRGGRCVRLVENARTVAQGGTTLAVASTDHNSYSYPHPFQRRVALMMVGAAVTCTCTMEVLPPSPTTASSSSSSSAPPSAPHQVVQGGQILLLLLLLLLLIEAEPDPTGQQGAAATGVVLGWGWG